MDSIDNKSALDQVMALYWASEKPLTEPVMIKFTDSYLSPGLSELRNSSLIKTQLWCV